jgi:Bacterial Ig-like domain
MESRQKTPKRRFAFDALESRALLTLFLKADNIVSTPQASFSGEVAVLVDTDLLATPSTFNTPPGSVQINWGDGSSPTSGTVVGTAIPGFFEVDGTHTFTQLGSFSTQINVTDHGGNSASAIGSAVVTVAPLTITASGVSGVAGTQFSLPVANFVDTNASDTMADFNALIEWGDGTSSTGAVVGGAGAFTVVGTHTYNSPGSYTTTVTVIGLGTAPSGSTTGQANIISKYKPMGTQIVAVSGQPLPNSTTVATFTDPTASDVASNFSAVISWGDGGTSIGTVSGSSGNFTVEGTYTYNVPGSYTATVTISNATGKPFTATDSVNVVNNTFSFSGQLSSVGNGPSYLAGYTNTNQPTFSGTAPPFSTVDLFAKPKGIDTALPLGEAVANGAGAWTLTSGPLAPGLYTVTATVTPSGGYPSATMSLTNNSAVYVDMAPPKHSKAVHRHKSPKRATPPPPVSPRALRKHKHGGQRIADR